MSSGKSRWGKGGPPVRRGGWRGYNYNRDRDRGYGGGSSRRRSRYVVLHSSQIFLCNLMFKHKSLKIHWYSSEQSTFQTLHAGYFFFQILPFVCRFFFKINAFKNYFQNIISVKQFRSRLGPTVWVQTVCKDYQETLLGCKDLSKQMVLFSLKHFMLFKICTY